jgi:hypothetical protein
MEEAMSDEHGHGGGGDERETSSPVCYADEADATYMGYAGREDIIAFLNELLEAERAGARVCLETAREAAEPEINALAESIHRDEARWCAMLMEAVKRMGGVPSERTGAFHEKAMAIADVPSRLAFLNRGQAWVVRKLNEMLPKTKDEALHRELDAMLKAHERNIERVARSGLTESH